MKSSGFCAVMLSLLAGTAHSHYIFTSLKIGGASDASMVRKNTNHNSPITDLKSNELRCNAGGAANGGVKTAPVAAGSKITWVTDSKIYHQGPVSMYMTKVPDASQADGSSKWFKIEDIGPKFAGGTSGQADWTATQQQEIPVTIPKCLAPGEYLLRAQQLAIHNPGSPPQFYIACAQLKVTGAGSQQPPAEYLASIPGAFKDSDPGYKANIYNNFNSYTVPGPKVWGCGGA